MNKPTEESLVNTEPELCCSDRRPICDSPCDSEDGKDKMMDTLMNKPTEESLVNTEPELCCSDRRPICDSPCDSEDGKDEIMDTLMNKPTEESLVNTEPELCCSDRRPICDSPCDSEDGKDKMMDTLMDKPTEESLVNTEPELCCSDSRPRPICDSLRSSEDELFEKNANSEQRLINTENGDITAMYDQNAFITDGVPPLKHEFDPAYHWDLPQSLPALHDDKKAAVGVARRSVASASSARKAPNSNLANTSSVAEKPVNYGPVTPAYVDLAYVPAHGDPRYADTEFFKRIRARYYVLSTVDPSPSTLDALLDGKEAWGAAGKNLPVTLVPTYDNQLVLRWLNAQRDRLEEQHVDLTPAAARCKIQLQDHDDGVAFAYRVEF